MLFDLVVDVFEVETRWQAHDCLSTTIAAS